MATSTIPLKRPFSTLPASSSVPPAASASEQLSTADNPSSSCSSFLTYASFTSRFSLPDLCHLLHEECSQLQQEFTQSGATFVAHSYVSAVQAFVDIALKQPEATFDPTRYTSLSTLRQMCWDAMHTGPWQEVELIWRKAYERCGLIECVLFLYRHHANACTFVQLQTHIQQVLKQLDLCVMMGANEPTFTRLVHRLIAYFEQQLQDMKSEVTTASPQPQIVNEIQQEQQQKKQKVENAVDQSASKNMSSSSTSVSLPILPTSPHATAIPRIAAPSLFEFHRNYMKLSQPVILTGVMDHWPACQSHSPRYWSLEYLKQKAGERTVPVELGANYLEREWGQQLMTLREFIDTHLETPITTSSSSASAPKSSQIGYLAQHALFDQIPSLRGDIALPDYCSLSTAADAENEDDASGEVTINAWIGPGGTVSPLHFDPDHNLFAQIRGSKYWRIIHPKFSQRLYPNGAENQPKTDEEENTKEDSGAKGILSNTSLVDAEHVDGGRFPLAVEVPYWECILKAGEMLYVPPAYWHYVRSLELSFSVSFWWK